jgi:hypothetical protein
MITGFLYLNETPSINTISVIIITISVHTISCDDLMQLATVSTQCDTTIWTKNGPQSNYALTNTKRCFIFALP